MQIDQKCAYQGLHETLYVNYCKHGDVAKLRHYTEKTESSRNPQGEIVHRSWKKVSIINSSQYFLLIRLYVL